VTPGAKVLIEQVVVLVNVSALGCRKLAAATRTFNLRRHTLRIEVIEFTADRLARFAGRKRSGTRITTAATGGAATSLHQH
jgi:hypothetical protein